MAHCVPMSWLCPPVNSEPSGQWSSYICLASLGLWAKAPATSLQGQLLIGKNQDRTEQSHETNLGSVPVAMGQVTLSSNGFLL